jgi:hypothetical protein
METQGTVEKEEKVCLDCGGPLGPGREDRRYCSDACKTNYNNRMRRAAKQGEKDQVEKDPAELPEFIIKIQAIQLRNRNILAQLCDEDRISRVRMRDLVGVGFNPKFFTSQADPTGDGHIYRFCFEYGCWEREDGVVTIVCRPREVGLLAAIQ